jgi:hypothetical protein
LHLLPKYAFHSPSASKQIIALSRRLSYVS